MRQPATAIDAIAQLCPACGLCCNGVLFADVELGAGDDPGRLQAQGLLPQPKRRKLAFNQPCPCLEGGRCRIYPERPKRCRTFECGLLKRVMNNETDPATALGRIRETTRQAEKVRELMRCLGDTNEHEPLSRRYARIMAEPIDLAGSQEAVDVRAQLMLSVDSLMTELQREFLA